jgi:hypothetical protein
MQNVHPGAISVNAARRLPRHWRFAILCARMLSDDFSKEATG